MAALDAEKDFRHSGMVRRTRPQMRNCASGNLEIPRCAIAHLRFALRRALSDKRYALARGMTGFRASILDPVPGLEDPPHHGHADGEERQRDGDTDADAD